MWGRIEYKKDGWGAAASILDSTRCWVVHIAGVVNWIPATDRSWVWRDTSLVCAW